LGTPEINSTTLQEFSNWDVEYDKPIGYLPTSESALYYVDEKGNNHLTHKRLGWFKSSIYVGQEPLTINTPYWIKGNATIYQLYETMKYEVVLTLSKNASTRYSIIKVEYGADIPLPNIIKEGYVFEGWKILGGDEKDAPVKSMKMPPKNIELYAVFKKEE
jgi:uncharacterized repeat protein (TIGR02543 family)